jgi:hypothetical protein
MTLVSSTNNNGCGIEFIVRGRSFICIMNKRGTRIDCWGTYVSMLLRQRKKI